MPRGVFAQMSNTRDCVDAWDDARHELRRNDQVTVAASITSVQLVVGSLSPRWPPIAALPPKFVEARGSTPLLPSPNAGCGPALNGCIAGVRRLSTKQHRGFDKRRWLQLWNSAK